MYKTLHHAKRGLDRLAAAGFNGFGIYFDPAADVYHVLTIAGPCVDAGFLLVR